MSTNTAIKEDKFANAMSQAKAQFESIKEMVEAYENAPGDRSREDAERAIHEDPLSVQVRSDWFSPGQKASASEYLILLCTGGPAVRITGKLNQYLEPETACLECQDWFLPWTDWTGNTTDTANVLMSYARHFYFGEY